MTKIGLIAICVIIILLLHHWWIHPEKKGLDRFFQVDDADSHEAWILFSAGLLVGAEVVARIF